jgi:hypothetical protein
MPTTTATAWRVRPRPTLLPRRLTVAVEATSVLTRIRDLRVWRAGEMAIGAL